MPFVENKVSWRCFGSYEKGDSAADCLEFIQLHLQLQNVDLPASLGLGCAALCKNMVDGRD